MSASSSTELMEEARRLIDCLLEERLSPLEGKRLEQLVCDHKDIRRMYLRYMHLHCSLPVHAGADALANGPRSMGGAGGSGHALSVDLQIGTIDDELAASEMPQADSTPSFAGKTPPRAARRMIPAWMPPMAVWASAGMAACLVVAVAIHFRATGKTQVATGPAARVTATAGAEWDGAIVMAGSELQSGDVLHLKEGGAEIVFASGAHALIEGPAVMTIVDRNSAALTQGKVAAHVPPEARGFRITSGNLVVTDLGTEFGLSVDKQGQAALDVFTGKVDVAHRVEAGTQIATTHLVQGQAVSGSAKQGTIKPADSGTETFVRDIAKFRKPITLHDTGVRLKQDEADPYWQVVMESFDRSFKPQAAVVAHVWHPKKPESDSSPPTSFTVFALDHRKVDPAVWITVPNRAPEAKPGSCSFRTLINLGGIDLKSVILEADVAADDSITDVRINGASTGVKLAHSPLTFNKFHHIVLPISKLISGSNTVEFMVADNSISRDFPLALNVKWAASGAPIVKREKNPKQGKQAD